MAVGEGYRTNAEGIRQLRALLDDDVDEVNPSAAAPLDRPGRLPAFTRSSARWTTTKRWSTRA
ncbi:MAG: hypothetical protein R2838_02565 [Caldilineaceae bacterium]